MKQMKKLTFNEIKERGIKTYYTALLMDENFFNTIDIVGNFETLEETKKECLRRTIEEIDETNKYMIVEYKINNQGKYTMTNIIYY